MEAYDITIRRKSDNAIFKADKVTFDWLLRFLKKQGFADVRNIKEGNQMQGRKSFNNKNATQKKINLNQ